MSSKNKKTYEPFDWKQLKGSSIVGVDEVGRGCLAGPVYAAAVILDPERDVEPFIDSKTLTESRREQLYEEIVQFHLVGIGFATVEEITELNILQASFLAMKRALAELKLDESSHILVDGKFAIPDIPYIQTPLIKGDFRAQPIGAASIVAKVTRDRLLKELSKDYPEYGFEKHKGYCTSFHKQKIKEFGPSIVHRPTFSGVKEYL
jgi:ribonuclease HII